MLAGWLDDVLHLLPVKHVCWALVAAWVVVHCNVSWSSEASDLQYFWWYSSAVHHLVAGEISVTMRLFGKLKLARAGSARLSTLKTHYLSCTS